jgi:hypothetical protein
MENGETNARNVDVMDGEDATEYTGFHTDSEFTEGTVEGEENSTDHVIQNKEQETEGEV